MIKAIDVTETKEYTLKSDTVDPTVWVIGVLDSLTRARIMDEQASIESDGRVNVNIRTLQIEAIRYGLKGWANFKMKGLERVFKTVKDARNIEIVSDESLKLLSPSVIGELANEILIENTFSEQDLKNSTPPSGLQNPQTS